MEPSLAAIRELIGRGDVEQAIRQLDEILLQGASPHPDEAYYLRGNAYRKLGNWQQALNNYRYAVDINPRSPAKEARRMLADILDFYNKDMYNQ